MCAPCLECAIIKRFAAQLQADFKRKPKKSPKMPAAKLRPRVMNSVIGMRQKASGGHRIIDSSMISRDSFFYSIDERLEAFRSIFAGVRRH